MRFEPFQDRLSRDIRNDLSRSLAEALSTLNPAPVRKTADRYLTRGLADCYRDYIRDRLNRYDVALRRIRNDNIADVLRQALVLSDLHFLRSA